MDRTAIINIYALIIIAILIFKGSEPWNNLWAWVRDMVHAYTPFRQGRKSADGDEPFGNRKAALEAVLRELNCEFHSQPLEDRLRITYDYQGGHFLIDAPHSANIPFQLLYPGLLTASLDEIDLIRYACNEVNTHSPWGIRACYTVNAEDNELNIHLMTHIPQSTDKELLVTELRKLMDCSFSTHRLLLESYSAHHAESGRYEQPDVEFTRSRSAALRQLMHEAEQESNGSRSFIIEGPEMLSVRNLLDRIGGGPALTPHSIEARAGDYQFKSDSTGAIMDYAIDVPLRSKAADEPLAADLVNADAFIRLDVIPASQDTALQEASGAEGEGQEEAVSRGRELAILLFLHAEGRSNNCLYFRLTWVVPDTIAGMGQSACFVDSQGATRSGTFLVCRDLDGDSKAKHHEASYMLDDAMDKKREGNLQDLTPEQHLILNLTDHDTAYNLYWGDRLYRERRYYEAAIRLERAWHALVDNEPLALQEKSDHIYETAYLLGMCFYKLTLFKDAYYYLNVATGRSDAKSHEALIDCMMALDDPRAITTVRTALRNLREQTRLAQKSGGDVPEAVSDHMHFLRRQEIRLYIHSHFLVEAEKLSKEMLHEDGDKDFALSALAKIQRMRGEGARERTPHFADERQSEG